MAFIPFISIPTGDQETDEQSNVVAFPVVVSAQEKLRFSERQLARTEAIIADGDGDSLEATFRFRAAQAILPVHRDRVRQAEIEVAMLSSGDTLTHRGVIYQALRSSAGAN